MKNQIKTLEQASKDQALALEEIKNRMMAYGEMKGQMEGTGPTMERVSKPFIRLTRLEM